VRRYAFVAQVLGLLAGFYLICIALVAGLTALTVVGFAEAGVNRLTLFLSLVTLAAAFGLRHLLFGISPLDPLTLTTSIVIIVAVTIAACIVPATAASRIEPRAALED